MDQLDKLVHNEAAKSGISKQQADKAVKMLRDGKVNMSQIAPHLKTMIMKNMTVPGQAASREELLERMSVKRQALREGRSTKQSRDHMHNKTKQQISIRKEKEEQEKRFKTEMTELQQNEHKRTLLELESKIGNISDDFYNKCLLKLQEDKFADAVQRTKCQNIVDLYQQQRQFENMIDMDDIADDVSDVSDE